MKLIGTCWLFCASMRFNWKYILFSLGLIIELNYVLFISASPIAVDRKRTDYDKGKIYRGKKEWLKQHLSKSRSKRSLFNKDGELLTKSRPCPINCSCNYDTVSCNDLIETCDECIHWPQIDFNQISYMRPESFKYYRFAPNRTTHIIIYKLLNSTITSNTFSEFIMGDNSHIEITFQYNSLIKFDRKALNGLYMGKDSTLVFNFPYTSQVIFLNRCFDGIFMSNSNAKLILRILKSFSVRFAGDFSYYTSISNHKKHTTDSNYTDESNNYALTSERKTSTWNITNGQFIIDIKSTHLVKFEDYSFADLNLKSNTKLFIDLELIEKLIVHRHTFANLILKDESKMIFYAKQITFIDFKAYSFSNMNLYSKSKIHVILEDLTSSFCVQRHVFSQMKLHNSDTSFNFSIINSKNIQIMHDSFANIIIYNKKSSIFIGVFNTPSLLLSQENNFYRKFLSERIKYLHNTNDLTNSHNSIINYHLNNRDRHQYSNHFVPAPFLINSEYYSGNSVNSASDLLSSDQSTSSASVNSKGKQSKTNNVISRDNDELYMFFLNNKQIYSYNFSIENNCFSNLTFLFNDDLDEEENFKNVFIAADNIHTLLIDNFIYNITNDHESEEYQKYSNLNFILNVKHFVLSKNSLQYVQHTYIEFLREPRMFKLGLAPRADSSKNRIVKIFGLDLNNFKSISDLEVFMNRTGFLIKPDGNRNNVLDYYNNENQEQDNVDVVLENRLKASDLTMHLYESDKFNKNDYLDSEYTVLDDLCKLVSLPRKDSTIVLTLREPKSEIYCSCQTILLLFNQLKSFSNIDELSRSNILPCKLYDFSFINFCRQQLDLKCAKKYDIASQDDQFLDGYIKFWDYCISEVDPLVKGYHLSNLNMNHLNSVNNIGSDATGYYYNSLNDADGLLSASLSSSFFDQSLDILLKQSQSSLSSSSSSSQSTVSNGISGNLGKVIGIVIVCFIVGIFLFMIAINIIQYKFRNEFDLNDFEYPSQSNQLNNSNAMNNNSRSSSNSSNNNHNHSHNDNNSNNNSDDGDGGGNLSNNNNNNDRNNHDDMINDKIYIRKDFDDSCNNIDDNTSEIIISDKANMDNYREYTKSSKKTNKRNSRSDYDFNLIGLLRHSVSVDSFKDSRNRNNDDYYFEDENDDDDGDDDYEYDYESSEDVRGKRGIKMTKLDCKSRNSKKENEYSYSKKINYEHEQQDILTNDSGESGVIVSTSNSDHLISDNGSNLSSAHNYDESKNRKPNRESSSFMFKFKLKPNNDKNKIIQINNNNNNNNNHNRHNNLVESKFT